MPERWDTLKAKLAELEAELARVDSLDDDARAALETAAAEINQVLRAKKAAPQPESLTTKLSDQALAFEAQHPNLSAAVHRVIDALGQIGI